MPTLDLGDLEEVDYDPFKRKGLLDQYTPVPEAQPQPDLTAAARAGKLGTLTGGGDSWSNNLAGGFSNTMGLLGATPEGQRNAFEFGQNLTSVIPGVSNVVSGNQAYRDFSEGNIFGGVLNTAAALPIPGAGMLERVGGKVVAKEVAHDFPGMLSKLGKGWEDAPVINQAGDFLHGSAEMDRLNQNLAMLNDDGTLSKGILAYHGTPHEFNKFDISKVGTGEGAQAYGHGLYFAEHPDVAESYRSAGANDPILKDKSGYPIDFHDLTSDAQRGAHDAMIEHGDFDKARSFLAHEMKRRSANLNADDIEHYDAVLSTLKGWRDAGYSWEQPPSAKYQVAIKHDPDKFFDLDAKFADQHPDVQKAANELFGRKFYKGMTGGDVYDFLNEKLARNSDFHPQSPDSHVALATEFNKRGIPGIRYFDEGSRESDAARTRNYVTFDDKNVKILKRLGYGGVLTLGGTGSVLAHPWKHQDLDTYQLDDEY